MTALPSAFSDWFRAKGWQPHPHQREMLARAGEAATLLVAPTGGGKTLAGFLPTLVDRFQWKRIATGVDCDPTNLMSAERKIMAKSFGNCFQDQGRLVDDFRADAVAGEKNNVGFQGIVSLIARGMVSVAKGPI